MPFTSLVSVSGRRGRKTSVFLVLLDTQSISVWTSVSSLCARWSLTKWTWGLWFLWVKWSQLLGQHFISSYSATHLCVISLTSPAKKSLLLSKEKRTGREREKYSMVHFIWNLMMLQTELARVEKIRFMTASSFCMQVFSVKKMNGFIMLIHHVHV